MQVKGKLPNLKSILKPDLENNSSFLVILVRFCLSDRKCAEKLFIWMLRLSWRYYSLFFNFFFLAIASAFKRVKEIYLYVSIVKKQLYVFKLIILP